MRHEGPTPEEKYKGRQVIVEVGGKLPKTLMETALLNYLDIPEDRNPLYIGIDANPKMLGTVPREGAPSSQMMVADITDPDFLEFFDELDGHVDRLFILNVLSDYPRTNGPVDSLYFSLLLQKIARMLKPGGKAYIGEWYTPDQLGDLPHTVQIPQLIGKVHTETKEALKTLKRERIKGMILKMVEACFSGKYAETAQYGKPFLLELTRNRVPNE